MQPNGRTYSVLIFLLLTITGCAGMNLPQPTGGFTETYYKKDLNFTVKGIEHVGVAVIDESDQYQFSITPDKEFDLFTAATCHREIDANKVDISRKKRLFGPSTKQSIRFSYFPHDSLEKDLESSYCPISFGVFDKAEGQEYWGFVDFRRLESLEAVTFCNGEKRLEKGVAICQARVGLLQKVEFDVETKLYSDCLDVKKVGTGYTFYMPFKECVSLFASDSEVFRFTTFGYNRIKLKDFSND